MEVYLDNSATTRTFPEVAELMSKIMCEDYGNPSSMHNKGVQAERYVRYGRETLAKILKVNEKEIYFTCLVPVHDPYDGSDGSAGYGRRGKGDCIAGGSESDGKRSVRDLLPCERYRPVRRSV